MDAAGNGVSVVGTDGTIYVQGNSEFVVTVASYMTEVNLDQAGTIDNFEEHNTL